MVAKSRCPSVASSFVDGAVPNACAFERAGKYVATMESVRVSNADESIRDMERKLVMFPPNRGPINIYNHRE